MIGGLVEIAENERSLSVQRGFLVVKSEDAELGRVPLDDVTALILSAPRAMLSKQVMVALAERNAVVVISGANYHPIALTLPTGTHYKQAGVLQTQIAASQPLRKNLWRQIVVSKIHHQRAALQTAAPGSGKIEDLTALAKRVKSGDSENREAQAARHYWQALMGTTFRRNRDLADANVLLNYGYMVLRAAMARATVAHGLNPGLGIHHKSQANAFQLVDDLMEPFRPQVDLLVRDILQEEGAEALQLPPEVKRRLAAVLQKDMQGDRGAAPVVSCMARLSQSLVASLAQKTPALILPEPRMPGKLL